MLPEGRVILFALFFAALPAAAQGSDQTFSCADKSTWTSGVQEAECLSDLAGSERLLGERLEQALIVMRSQGGRGDAVKALEAGQSTWAAYRDAHCDYIMISGGSNTMGSSDRMWCLADMNRKRAAVLELEASRWAD